MTGNSHVIKWLLDNGASVNESDAYGDLPLHYAAFCGHVYATYLLLQAGADPHKCSGDGKSPTLSAFEERHWGVVHLIRLLCPTTKDLVPPFPSSQEQEVAESQLIAEGLQDLLTAAYTAPAASPGTKSTLFRRILGKKDGPTSPKGDGDGSFPLGAAGAGSEGSRVVPRSFPLPAREPLPPPEAVAGLDFSRGVILEGSLQKKRVNRMLKWRTKYFVLSNQYRALFFWSGSRSRVESVIKKIRFETVYAIRLHSDKKLGRRFDIKVASGRIMQVQASTPEEAALWCHTLRTAVAPYMGALKIQALWRGHRLRRRLKRDREDRQKVMTLITSPHAVRLPPRASPTGASAAASSSSSSSKDADRSGISPTKAGTHGKVPGAEMFLPQGPLSPSEALMEGELRKRNHNLASSLISAFRTRYFVLHREVGALVYYENKAKRMQGSQPRVIPIVNFHSTRHPRNKVGDHMAQFSLRLTNGTMYVFETRTPEEAALWVHAIQRILPTDHVAALRIQKWYRSCRAKRNVKFLRQHLKKWSADAAKEYKVDAGSAQRAGYVLLHFFERLASERRLRKRQMLGDNDSGQVQSTPMGSPRASPGASRLGSRAASRGGSLVGSRRSSHPGSSTRSSRSGTVIVRKKRELWTEMKEPGTGRVYYYNVDTEISTWQRPTSLDDGSARLVTSFYSRYDPERQRKYYVNVQDNSTSWVRPAGYVSTDDEYETEVAVDGAEAENPTTTTTATATATCETAAAPASPSATERPSIAIAPSSPPVPSSVPGAEPPTASPPLTSTGGGRITQNLFSPATDTDDYVEIAQELHPVPPLAARVAQQLLMLAQSLPGLAAAAPETGAVADDSSQPMDLCALLKPYLQLGWMPVHDLGSGRVVYIRPAIKQMAVGVPLLPRSGASATGFRGHTGIDSDSEDEEEQAANAADSEMRLAYIDETRNKEHVANELYTFSHWIQSVVSPKDSAAAVPEILPLFQNHAQLANVLYSLSSSLFPSDTLHTHTIPTAALDPQLPTGATFRRKFGAGTTDGGPVVVRPGRDNLRVLLSYLAASGGLLPPRLSLASLETLDSAAILDLLWTAIRHAVFQSIHPASTLSTSSSTRSIDSPHFTLLVAGETMGDYLRLSPETLLLRWANLHLLLRGLREGTALPLAGHVDSFGHLWSDGRLLCALVGAVCPPEYTKAVLPPTDKEVLQLGPDTAVQRALQAATLAGVPDWFRPEHFTALHVRVQTLFLALLFRAHPRWDLLAARDTAPATTSEKYFTVPGVLGPVAAYHTRPALPILLGLPDTVYPRCAFASATERTSTVQAFFERVARQSEILTKLYSSPTGATTKVAELQHPEKVPSNFERDFLLLRSWVHARFGPAIVIQSLHPVPFVHEIDDGLLPLQIIDDLAPGEIVWDEVHIANMQTGALTPAQRLANWCQVRNVLVRLKITPSPAILSASDAELQEIRVDLCLDTMYSLMRHHCLYSLSAHVFKNQVTDEKPLLEWFNERILTTARVFLHKEMTEKEILTACEFASLGDSGLQGGIALAFLLQGLRPGYLDWERIPANLAEFHSLSEEEKLALGDYLRTVAGRAGCYVLPHAWDLVHPRPLHMLVALSSILLSTVS